MALSDGRVYAAGAPEEIVDEVLVKQVFGLDSRVIPDPVTGHADVRPDRANGVQSARDLATLGTCGRTLSCCGATTRRRSASFYERHVGAVTAYLGRRTRQPDVLFDLLGETFARAYEHRRRTSRARARRSRGC